jgi:hypothetical protein
MRLKYGLALLMSAGAVLVSAQDATPTPDPCTDPVNMMIHWVTQNNDCALHEEISFTFNASYPHDIAAQSPFAGSVMLNYINEERKQFWTNATVGGTPEFFGSGPWTLDMSYETFYHSPSVVSVLFDMYTYTGGAHPNTYFKTFTFDLENESLYTLEGLFQEGVDARETLAPIARVQLQQTLADFPDFIDTGTEPHPDTTTYPGLDNYANWVLTEDALVLYFPPYQVAPYVAGPQTVSIPLVDLQNVLNPAFLPGS